MQNGTVRESFGVHQIAMDLYLLRGKATVPWHLWARMQASMVRSGANLGLYVNQYTACTHAAISSLPIISFTFAHGSLVYYPDEYVKYNETDQTCHIQVGAGGPGRSSLVLEPLFIPDANVRVTRDNIWEICDSV